jgi:hypothetical protein
MDDRPFADDIPELVWHRMSNGWECLRLDGKDVGNDRGYPITPGMIAQGFALVRAGIRIGEQRERERASELIRVGKQMSNVCFNLSQREAVDEYTCETMDDLRRRWDAARAKVVEDHDGE